MTHVVVYTLSSGLWMVLAILNARYAETRNDRALKWFVLSLGLGPLASLLIAARPRLDRAPGERRTLGTVGWGIPHGG
jgi:hypothetical protein